MRANDNHMIDNMFFELLRVAVGNAERLSRMPSEEEWEEVYDMARKQAVAGICFAGLQRLGADPFEGFRRIGMSENLYLRWMGMATRTQHRNEKLNAQCAELSRRFMEKGFRTCVLKGQGTAHLYGNLALFRSSGDIDMWIMPQDVRSIKESKRRVSETIHRLFPEEKGAYIHIGFPALEDTDVELHFVPTMDANPWRDRRLRKLFEDHQDACFMNVSALGFAVPEKALNVFFNLHHIKRHFISEGIGLRHIMDFHYVLKDFLMDEAQGTEAMKLVSEFGLKRFLSAVLWIDNHIFCGPESAASSSPIASVLPDEHLGRIMLEEIMRGGNFGHHDDRLEGNSKKTFAERWKSFMDVSVVRFCHFPADTFWAWVFRMRVGFWRRTGKEI